MYLQLWIVNCNWTYVLLKNCCCFNYRYCISNPYNLCIMTYELWSLCYRQATFTIIANKQIMITDFPVFLINSSWVSSWRNSWLDASKYTAPPSTPLALLWWNFTAPWSSTLPVITLMIYKENVIHWNV